MATQAARHSGNVQAQTQPSFRDRLAMQGGMLPYLLVLPVVLVIVVVAVYPMLYSLYISLLDNPLIDSPGFVGLQNYVQVFNDPVFQVAIGTTLIFSFISVALEALFGLGIALLINQAFPGRGLVRTAILVPWAFPTVVSAQMWLLMYNDQTGIITYLLQLAHLLGPGATLVGSRSGVIIAAVITDVWKTTPFMALLILAGLQVIPADIYEAASVDGATRWQRFTLITLPQLKTAFLVALLFRALDAIRAFDVFYIFGQRSVPSMASYANFKMFAGTTLDFAPGVAAAVVVFFFGAVISLVIVSLMGTGALKRS